jgi:hypothetical protein
MSRPWKGFKCVHTIKQGMWRRMNKIGVNFKCLKPLKAEEIIPYHSGYELLRFPIDEEETLNNSFDTDTDTLTPETL